MTFADYNLNIPNAPNNPSNDQPLMQTNTNSISSLISIDHFGFNNSNGGLHKQVNLVTEASPPLLGNEVLYTTNLNGRNVLWSNNGIDNLPLFFRASNSNPGFTSMYGGTILQFGSLAVAAAGSYTPVTFALAFPTAIYSIVVTMINNQGTAPSANSLFVTAGSVTLSGFTITNTSSSSTQSAYWMAIGN